MYYKHLKNNKNIYIQSPKYKDFENIYWVVGILILDKNITANLIKKIIQTRNRYKIFFWPMNKQKIVKKYNLKLKGNFKNSEMISKYGLYLPSGLGTTQKEIKYICDKLNSIL